MRYKKGLYLLQTSIGLPIAALACAGVVQWMPPSLEANHLTRLPAHAATAHQVVAEVASPASGGSSPRDFAARIGIPDAWPLLKRDVTATIAIVDTGVDFDRPELQPFLLEGENVLDEQLSAQDDNGHGTEVAGVIAAIAKAGENKGPAHWTGRILPVKALNENGESDARTLAKGIRYAAQQGANIIVLSLGLRRDAPELREAVAWAETKGVLLVAASGNDAATFGAKATVQYPAAYSSVLAVAGSVNGKPAPESTHGPEVDLAAEWRVETLALKGGTVVAEGSSMAAPQVAAVAAMLMASHPEWKPLKLRETLRRSAANDQPRIWSPGMGYGQLTAERALLADARTDWREKPGSAAIFPTGKEISAAWDYPSDQDFYTVNVPYNGYYTVAGDARFSLYAGNKWIRPQPGLDSGSSARWKLPKGNYLLKAAALPGARSREYRLISRFDVAPDAMEPNDKPSSAFVLPARSQQWSGTFHKPGDEDWAVLTLPKDGELRIGAKVSTARIDLAMLVLPDGEAAIVEDEAADGGTERLVLKHAKAGKYFFRFENAESNAPVIGTYTISLEYITKDNDAYGASDDAKLANRFSDKRTPLLARLNDRRK
jgi:hypothetical protein